MCYLQLTKINWYIRFFLQWWNVGNFRCRWLCSSVQDNNKISMIHLYKNSNILFFLLSYSLVHYHWIHWPSSASSALILLAFYLSFSSTIAYMVSASMITSAGLFCAKMSAYYLNQNTKNTVAKAEQKGIIISNRESLGSSSVQ